MKITRPQLRRIINEAARPTVGAVLDAVEVVREIEDEKEKKAELHKLEKKLGWKLGKMIPVIGPAVGAVKDLGDIYKVLKKDAAERPEKHDDPILDLFQVDPQYKEMLDDSVEFDFDNDMLAYLGTLSRDEPLPDMTKELEKWIRKKFGREITGADVSETLSKRSETLLKQVIREIMDPPPEGTPDQILGTPGSDADMPTEKKAALGFINNMMGTSPAADQLDGMGSDIQDYANKYGISSASLKDQLSQILPSSGEHPNFQVDDASGSVSSTDGKKVYGEGYIRRLVREAIENESQLRELLEAGHFDQAIALADALGISGRELPWSGELLEDYVYEKLKHIPMQSTARAHQAKIDALDVLDISLEEYMGPSPLMMYYNSRR